MSSVLEEQRRILTALFDATSGPAWRKKEGWNTDASLENWVGVTVENGHVVKLNLAQNGLKGTIPLELGKLTELRELYLSMNNLEGNIPPELGDLQNLQKLYLANNELTGSSDCLVPLVERGASIWLEDNTLGDDIGSEERAVLTAFFQATSGPSWMNNGGWCSELPAHQWKGVSVVGGHVIALDLHGNELQGEIPKALGGLNYLAGLRLDDNKLSGSIPRQLGKLSDLQQLWLNENNLEGTIPLELGKLTELRELYLSKNNLEGNIPPRLGQLSNLRELLLSRNSLEGSIPAELGGLEKLEKLGLADNKLTRTIPPQLGKLSNLRTLWLSGNNLEGNIPSELGKLAELRQLQLERNNLGGSIPRQLGQLSKLQELSLELNDLEGEIPPELGALRNLQGLYLSNNELTGNIPKELGKLAELRRLWLQDNNLEGNTPKELGRLSQLTELRLHSNRPEDGTAMKTLRERWLSHAALASAPTAGNFTSDSSRQIDALDYKTYAEAILYGINQVEAPIAVGIYGEWGCGKSFLLHAIREQILQQQNKTKVEAGGSDKGAQLLARRLKGVFVRCLKGARRLIAWLGQWYMWLVMVWCFVGWGGISDTAPYGHFRNVPGIVDGAATQRPVKYINVEFNAWLYAGSDKLWAGVIQAMFKAVEEHSDYGDELRLSRLIEAVKEQGWRNFAFPLGVLVVVVLSVLTSLSKLDWVVSQLSAVSAAVPTLLGLVGLTGVALQTGVLVYRNARKQGDIIVKEAQDLGMGEQLGFMASVRDRLEFLYKFLKASGIRLSVEVDDLDRCGASQVMAVLEATMLLLCKHDAPVVAFLAVDPRVVVTSIEESF